jgi:predicted membrane protein
MFLAIVFILLGLFLLLNAMGVIAGNFWGFFWAILFIAVGLRMLMKNGNCPMCCSSMFHGKINKKMESKMEGGCCDHCHEDEE